MIPPAVGEGRQSTGKQKPSAEVMDLGPQLGRGGAVRGAILRECLLCLCAIKEYMRAASYRWSLEARAGGSCVLRHRYVTRKETWAEWKARPRVPQLSQPSLVFTL